MNFTLANGTKLALDLSFDPVLSRYFQAPKAQVPEMIRQINAANYYAGVFPQRSDLTFLDLGANLGFVSLWASPLCRRVVAVEPEPTTYVMLKTFMAKFAPNVVCIPAALAKITGPVMLSIDKEDYSCHTAINPKPGNCSLKVDGFCFADLLERCGLKDGIDVCKVDVEGAEMESLTEQVLEAAPVKTWYIEVHKTPVTARPVSLALMVTRLKGAGYSVVSPRVNALIAKR